MPEHAVWLPSMAGHERLEGQVGLVPFKPSDDRLVDVEFEDIDDVLRVKSGAVDDDLLRAHGDTCEIGGEGGQKACLHEVSRKQLTVSLPRKHLNA